MTKDKCLILGMLAMALALGLFFAGCTTTDEPNTDPKSIKIIGFNLKDKDGFGAYVVEYPQLWSPSNKQIMKGNTSISGSDITVELKIVDGGEGWTGEPWTGNGKYYLWIYVDDPAPGRYYYFYAFEGTSPVSDGTEVDYNNVNGIAPIYIDEAVTTLEFSRFIYRGYDSTAG
jgi:hypothetical protein